VNTHEDVETFSAEVGRLEAEHGHERGRVRFIVLGTETPQSALNVADLVRSERVAALSWGAEDLSAAIGARRNRDETGALLDVFRYCRVQTLLAATAADRQPIDTVYVNIRDLDGLRRDCQEAVWMGFTGRLTIHPDQIPIVNELFTPSREEATEAHELLEGVEAARQEGRGAFTLRGQMVDSAHVGRAETLLARARQAGVI
jgi:citrate lyase subunit beta / citryl-CoA lyase